jgi:hypothetical protein
MEDTGAEEMDIGNDESEGCKEMFDTVEGLL